MKPFLNQEIFTNVYNKIKQNELTDKEYKFILFIVSKYRTKEHIDEYIQKIKNGEESLNDFLTKMQHLG